MTPFRLSFWRPYCFAFSVICNRRVALALAAAVLLFVGRPVLAQSQNQKIDHSLQSSLHFGAATQKVIVTVDDPDLRSSIRQALVAHGDLITADHPLVGAFAAEVHSEDVELLANHKGVHAVSADAAVSAGSVPQGLAKALTPQAGNARALLGLLPLSNSNAPRGEGIGIALIDSGISPTADIKVSAFFDFTRGGIPVPPFDDYGHGTFIAGLIGSSGVLSDGQFPGIAPDVTFVGLKVLDKTGQGTTSDVIKAIEYVTANRAKLHVQIINLSLGHPIFAKAADDPLVQAVEQASATGLIVVVAGGNNGQNPTTGLVGYAGINSPGNSPVGDHRWRRHHARHADARRRPRGRLQLARPDVVRRLRQARRRRAGDDAHLRHGPTSIRISTEPGRAAVTSGTAVSSWR